MLYPINNIQPIFNWISIEFQFNKILILLGEIEEIIISRQRFVVFIQINILIQIV